MTVSMKVMSAGDGYQYLLKSVVVADGNRALLTPLTRYYTEAGTPPGWWLGSGLHALGAGAIRSGGAVTEAQLALLLGSGRDPILGSQLGRAYRQFEPAAARVAARVAALDSSLTKEQHATATAEIENEERELGRRRAVAGFDFTFSVPKSVSVLWGVADAGTQALIVEAHHQAVKDVIELLERDLAATRMGHDAGDGAVVQADVVGVIAAAFDHWDSRLGDPQLHTHVVVSNKVQTVCDGRWRSLDSRALHAGVVALSEHYNAVLADQITRLFGLDWEQRERGRDRNPSWELALVPETLVRAFSSRARAIEGEKDRLIDEYVAAHGARPSRTTVIRLRAQATLDTRPAKQIRSLADLTAEWRRRATEILASDAPGWARQLASRRSRSGLLEADDIDLNVAEHVAEAVVEAVSEKRSTWRHWNLWAEASRQTMGWRFASAEARTAAVGLIVDAAESRSVRITPSEVASCPAYFARRDGTSGFRPRHAVTFTSAQLLAAEDRLLARADDRTAPTADVSAIHLMTTEIGLALSDEQVTALMQIVGSGRAVDVLIGPAGTGKTSAMRALRGIWESEHGSGTVVGLAPSAAAAGVLADDLGIVTENTAKWLFEFDRGNVALRPSQLVIVDEATLAGTLALDRLTAHAQAVGAKVLLAGDWAQLQSVDAGGAFSLLSERRDAAQLTEVHRFTHDWEKHASIALRHGNPTVVDTYIRQGRVREGTKTAMIDAAYASWRADLQNGCASILVTDANSSLAELNIRARADRLLTGDTLAGPEVLLAAGDHASAGDLIITRRNDRRLQPARGGWVRNGDRWRVLAVGRDGSLQVERLGAECAARVTLAPAYVAQYVDLGYAVTAHRAQGITVDSAHAVIGSATTRESLYVAMTRGRDTNTAYVALDQPDETHAPPQLDDVSARTVLHGVLRHCAAELSAHQTIAAEQERWSSVRQLVAEYETIAAVAQRDRWIALLECSGLRPEDVPVITTSDSFGPLTAELRRAEALSVHLETELPRIVDERSLADAEDLGAVLRSRLERLNRRRRPRCPSAPRLIGGIIPAGADAMPGDMAEALKQRQAHLERHVHHRSLHGESDSGLEHHYSKVVPSERMSASLSQSGRAL